MTYIMCAERILPAQMCRNEQPKGAREPRRQACSTGRGASGPGLGGDPNERIGKSEKDIPIHCSHTLSEISDNVGNQKFIFIRNGLRKVLKT